MAEPQSSPLESLRDVWEGILRSPRRHAMQALALLSAFVGLHLARAGTGSMRLAGALLLILPGVASLVWARRRQARWQVPQHILSDLVGRVDAPLAAAAARALDLEERTRHDPSWGSPALARRHLAGLLSKIDAGKVRTLAGLHARRWARAGLLLLACSVLTALFAPWHLLEGLDVLLARDGMAPVPLSWVDELNLVVTPPAYLRAPTQTLEKGAVSAQPRGSAIVVRARPLRPGRTLLLSDGEREVPFVSDGQGGVLARYTLGDSKALFVAARFGSVLIPEPLGLEVHTSEDAYPQVQLESAPRVVKLSEEPAPVLRWQASDDHGLRQIELVLRAGTVEERREISRPQSGARKAEGAHTLRGSDAFLSRSWGPVSAWIEAKDDDGVSGPKWGKSEVLVLLPPALGELEAKRMRRLLEARDAVVDLLASRLGLPQDQVRGRDHGRVEEREQERAESLLSEAVEPRSGGPAQRRRVRKFLEAQLRRLDDALRAEARRPGPEEHAALVATTEQVLLALDALAGGLAGQEARKVARRLGDIAEEAALALRRQPRALAKAEHVDDAAAEARVGVALEALASSAPHLASLGELGADLGSRVSSDLKRIRRARESLDDRHAALAAEDLATRLRNPDPSYLSSGGHGLGRGDGSRSGKPKKGGSAGGEAGQETGEDQDSDGDASERRAERELQSLEREHAEALRELSEALKNDQNPQEAPSPNMQHPGEKEGPGARPEAKEGDPRAPGETLDQLLDRLGRRESELVRRARALREKAEQDENLPEESREDLERAAREMEAAAKALREREGGRAAEHERAAQRHLERHHEDEDETGDQGSEDADSDGERGRSKEEHIPKADAHRGPEAFRRRVLQGLGGVGDPALREALERYAEGLLR